jgi:hypothetical protein
MESRVANATHVIKNRGIQNSKFKIGIRQWESIVQSIVLPIADTHHVPVCVINAIENEMPIVTSERAKWIFGANY